MTNKRKFSFSVYIPVLVIAFLFLGLFFYFFVPISVNYESKHLSANVGGEKEKEEQTQKEKEKIKTTHIEKPESVKAVYLTSWAGGVQSFRDRIINLLKTTEINTVVIDVKDYSGKLAFETNSKLIKEVGSSENRIPDIKSFINKLHRMDIYVIGRVVVFQDSYFAEKNPAVAVLKESDRALWSDKKGLHYLDPGSKKAWKYIAEIAKESYRAGFDEINFDYIRYPSDGDISDIYFPITNERAYTKLPPTGSTTTPAFYGRAEVLKEFFAYLNENLEGITTSADLFGMTTIKDDDLNIGQILEYVSLYFDYICPMVYPSHYPPGFNGWANPNSHPYEVVYYSMSKAVERLKSASTTPLKLRPWLQDFDYGRGHYGAAEVEAQIKATHDAGLTSWMLWSSKNVYTRKALQN